MTADDVITVFEQMNAEGRADYSLDDTCAGFAGWLAEAWERLPAQDIALLTAVGAVLWREGFALRQK
ncbi:hypothetical protein LMG22037_02918 [Paraburkholderia phenoliruptrix]|uniref:Uncharacterized protein n=1 Tax=Paraburkholderia phenoliruptrix TaxID=252970 RepID=A0A6J5B467_9BURK|nr:hypothetical protein [Paraburkholderia phenoliruptrix]CAB3689786.1 hypothetical protein LMG22037_02918 [Paraburkholderia phenoliruptrix]